ncbi:protocadherin-9 [Plakobranchus ocellatus]|uniref:Protocadherin-9 n=1 Tax=Plakobranchus ocellatus TaxID=259542 RepID=A0AAV4CH02_9GAST|nr:protocadherin-9 [Plakobranchus ocellatus]
MRTIPLLLLLPFVFLGCTITSTNGQENNQQQRLTFTVVEEEPTDTPVGSVSTSSIILDKVPEADRSQLSYSLQAKESSHQTFFKIDRQSGNITVASPIDREAVCPWTNVCVLQFDAIANRGNFMEQILVAISVEDINDNPPKFDTSSTTSGVYEVRFPESSPIESSRPLLTATDADMSVSFGVQNYNLEPASSIFSLDVTKNAVGTPQVNLVLKEVLDRETDANYTLRLEAWDGGVPPNMGALTVLVLVEDINDHRPKFSSTNYSASFSETEGEGYEIVQVHATDEDEGKNGRVVYYLSSQQTGENSASIVGKVVVNRETGSVRLSQPLESGTYTIIVEARDMGDSYLADQAAINVIVLDTDNNQPIARLVAVPASDDLPEGWVSESEPVKQVVGFLTVEDPDSGSNGNVSCVSLEKHFQLEQMNAGYYRLVLAEQLDYETEKEHTVQAVCKDQGSPSLNTTATLVLKVADKNDEKPEFTKDLYEERIFENNVVGDTVVVVTAIDRDSGERGKVQYRLSQDAGSNFTISPYDGVVRATIRFDRETKAVYEFSVIAFDGGSPSQSANASVRIEIRDKNDVAPVFGRPKYKFHLYENRDADSVVGNITVSDPDLGDGGKIKLSLVFDDNDDETDSENTFGSAVSINDNNDPFSITDEGKIYSRKIFDREVKSSYTFFIIATDNGQRKLSSSVEATVEILDVNDHRPTFSFPSEHNFSALANIPIHSDASVLKVDVTDKDSGKNSIVSYSIVSTNASAGLFRIGKFSGEIVASRDIGLADLGTFYITVNASDQGSPPLWENRTLHLVIQAEAAGSTDEVIADQNVLIVVCIVCFTVIVSGGIFIALCVLRRLDRQRKLQYAATCCPSNRSGLDSSGSNAGPAPQQYDLAPPVGKESSLAANGALSPYHQYSNHQLNSSKDSTNAGGSGDSSMPQIFNKGPQSGYAPAAASRAVPLSSGENQRKVSSAPPRQEDHHSTSSTETGAGDSGHGSDEEFSNSLDHSSAPALTTASAPSVQNSGTSTSNPLKSFGSATNASGAARSSDKTNLGGSARYPYSGQPHNPHDLSSQRAGQIYNHPGSGSSGRNASKVFPFTDRGSLLSTFSNNETPTQFSNPSKQEYPLTAIPPQRRKNSSVRFHPLVTDISEQASYGQPSGKTQSPQNPMSGYSGQSGSSNNVSGHATTTPTSSNVPPPPPRQPQHQQPPQPPPHSKSQQHFRQQRPSSFNPSHPYHKQHALLPPLSVSSTSSSPLNISDSKRNLRLHGPAGVNGRMKQMSQLSPVSGSSSRGFSGQEMNEESDLNTTTSGSYSVASDDVECRLNDFGDTADAYV